MARPDPEWTDEALAEKARGGDEEAFRVLFERHAPGLRPIVRQRLSGLVRRKVAESDVIQMTYASLHQSLHRFADRGAGSFRAWLEKILEHRLKDELRRYVFTEKRGVRHELTGPEPVDPGRYPSAEPTPSAVAADHELRRVVARAMERLPADQRRVLELVQGEALTLAEAGRRLDRSSGAAKQLYARALARLRQLVRETRDERHG
jgi:RNA polymerase sigma-70 factor (ECF subfamily)